MTHNRTLSDSRVVYIYLDSDGDIAYVGEGRYSRPYEPHHQGEGHVDFFMEERFAETPDLRKWIKFVGVQLDKEEARILEHYLITKYRPVLNAKGSSTGVIRREILEAADRKIGWTMLKMGISKLYRSPRQALSLTRRAISIYRSQGSQWKTIR